ncbi:MAG: pyridoxal-phosphate dependent enzyme [Chloroflexi bacterium]|nr:pyridoxal-phosphate dependent enzyme [Chloroflexota bacterium]
MVRLDDVLTAREIIGKRLVRTPLLRNAALSARIGRPIYLKLENLQQTGSFKPRGVLTKIASLNAEEMAHGLITISAGNHAQALAYSAQASGVHCTVVMPSTAPASKVANTRNYGAEVILHPDSITLLQRMRVEQEAHGYTYVAPFDDPHIIAGQGTVGLEVMEDLPEVATGAAALVVPIGGGGLISGIATAVKGRNPAVRVFGVEPDGAPTMFNSLAAGHAIHLDRVSTIADGLAAPFAGEWTYSIIRELVDDVVLISDEEIAAAVPALVQSAKVVPEPAGATALGALLAGRIPLDTLPAEAPVVVIVSGGNLDLARLVALLTPQE